MLDQYIEDQLRKNEDSFRQLNEKLQRLQTEEENYNHLIEKLLEKEDVGIEFFSPRTTEDSTRTKVSKIKMQMEEIRFQQAEVRDEISRLKKEETRYQEMLDEIDEKNRESQQTLIEDEVKLSKISDKEELKKILNRLDKCIMLLNSNKTQCKNEMINLKYYLKALISSK